MSGARDIDTSDVTDEREPAPLPPIPADPPELAARLMHPGDGHADFLGLERRIDLLGTEVRDGFKLLGEQLLPAVRKIDERQADHHRQLAEHTRLLFALGDRQNEIVARQERQDARLDAVEAEIAAIRKPAKKRHKAGKR